MEQQYEFFGEQMWNYQAEIRGLTDNGRIRVQPGNENAKGARFDDCTAFGADYSAGRFRSNRVDVSGTEHGKPAFRWIQQCLLIVADGA
ncbi:MAG: hypothetical protein K2W95_23180 [Candidatus Obscuribacterales bacterium]|nr:hypothetical protein [Candidatus Obscuribacterales bacterium]